jgi:D-alanyl-D-alanine carboxypeptidase/D-alanyl-D-alanine-endopeptidase (penicillin-binding protein 4)
MKTVITIGLAAIALAPGVALSQSQGAEVPTAAAAMVAPAAIAPSVNSLRTDLEQILSRPRWNGDRWSVMVVSLDRGDTLFAHGADEKLAPASNMKLFTTAAALYYLGPDYRYNTFLMATGPIQDGVIAGDLVVYGTGDPTFSDRFGNRAAVWQAFADTLTALGIREVRGDIIGDGSYFQESYMNAAYAASAGALSFAENVAMLQIRPGAQVGWRPEIELVPGGEGIAIVNQATTVAGRGTNIHAARVAYDGPIAVRGHISRGSAPVLRSVPVSDPARFAAAAFREVLSRQGITVTGTVRSVSIEAESPVTGRSVFAPALDSRAPVRVLAVHTSEPLLQILEIINKRSHNLMAEQVLRTVGRVAVGVGTVEGGAKAVQHMLTQHGNVVPGAVEMYDGSGLSVLNRASARGFIELLGVMARSPMWNYYWETLPEAGAPDGLRRMYRTGAERNLRAKTGTIDHVSALSGYVRARNGERLAFSIISNNVPSTFTAKRVEDAIGARLAGFDRPVEQPPAGTTPAGTATAPAAPPGVGAPPVTGAPAPAPTPSPPASAAAPTRTHRVGRGETLSHIARRYGVTVQELERANAGLNSRRLSVGQSVRIPGVAPASTAAPRTAATASRATSTARSHTIRSGDTLDGIARRYSTTVRALQRANPGLNARRLVPGRTVRIP